MRLLATERAERALAMSVAQPKRVLLVALAVAVVGWTVDTQTEVVSDVRELVPRDLQALEDVQTLEDETGVAGEIDVTVRADDITRPEVVSWMTSYQQKALEDAGYSEGDRCQQGKDPARPVSCASPCPRSSASVDIGNRPPSRGCWTPCPPTSPRAW